MARSSSLAYAFVIFKKVTHSPFPHSVLAAVTVRKMTDCVLVLVYRPARREGASRAGLSEIGLMGTLPVSQCCELTHANGTHHGSAGRQPAQQRYEKSVAVAVNSFIIIVQMLCISGMSSHGATYWSAR